MARPPGLSVRLRLTLSYAGFLLVAGALLLAVVWAFLLRYVPDGVIPAQGDFVPNRSDLMEAFLPRALLALVLLLLLGLAGGWLLAGRMLAPLDRLRDGARIVGSGDLSHRIRLEGREDEFRELADAFDAMLAQLEARTAEQQRFAANASHELRTPLAITQGLLEVARSDPRHDHDELLERLLAVNSRASDLTEALLLLSRAEQRSFRRETVDLSLLAEDAVETLLPLAEKRGVTIELTAGQSRAGGSRALLLQMTMNLVHNAIVHNRPEGGTVRVTTAAAADVATITVENSGEVLDPDGVARLTEPFQRGGGRARAGDHGGVGLGLAIVASIARAHDGLLSISRGPSGGLRVVVDLPAVPVAAAI